MRTETRTIGGFKYEMTQVGMETGEQIVLRLSQPLAALFAHAAAKGGEEVTLQELAASGIVPALRALSGRDLRYVRKHLVANCTVYLPDGDKLRPWPLAEHYNEHFAGRYVEALQWFKWGLEMNRFFGSALGRVDALLAKHAASKSKSPQDARGGSGGSSSPSTEARA